MVNASHGVTYYLETNFGESNQSRLDGLRGGPCHEDVRFVPYRMIDHCQYPPLVCFEELLKRHLRRRLRTGLCLVWEPS